MDSNPPRRRPPLICLFDWRLPVLVLIATISVAAGAEVVPGPADEPTAVRVGVFENHPIVFTHARGHPAGIAIDVLQAVARKARWQLHYVHGSWPEQLARLRNGEIDLLVGIAYSAQRAETMDFNREHLIGNWGVLYKRADVPVDTLFDLQGRRVAMMEDSTHTQALTKLLQSFNVDFQPVLTGSYEEVLAAVQQDRADAGAVNRIFGIMRAGDYALAPTGVVFNPIYVHFAVPKGIHGSILETIDRELSGLKRNSNSLYYRSLDRWLTNHERATPSWMIWAAIGGVLLLLLAAAGTWFLRFQVQRKTRELSEQSQELKHERDAHRQAQERLNELAYFDPLTGLPNRFAFTERFDASRHDADRYHTKIAVLLLDIDRFKNINDSLGHTTGDRLLQAVAKRLQTCLRGADAIYRFGGDEFVITIGHVVDLQEVSVVAQRLLASLAGPLDLGRQPAYATASIGIALYPDHATSLDELLRNADAAMYAAKEHGRNQSQLYDPSLTLRAVERFTTETRLRAALDREELTLHYQPIVHLPDQRCIGVEALVRWNDPARGLVPPKAFVPSAEESGMIIPIGKWVLVQACHDVRQWEDQGLGELRLSVNVSSRQFEHRELLGAVREALQISGLPAHRLELEITEGVFLLLTDEVRETLTALTDLGVRLAIDDFGTGYSSLGFLKHLPFDDLKIDRSFVSGIPSDADDVQIATTIINMARDLGMAVVAEGIETREQYRFLRTHGCTSGQGNFFSGPLPSRFMADWLRKGTRRRAVGAEDIN